MANETERRTFVHAALAARFTTVTGEMVDRVIASVGVSTIDDLCALDASPADMVMDDDFHVVEDSQADDPHWRWHIEGQQIPSGTVLRTFEDTGVIQAEGAGEALDWLVNHGPIWDNLDTSVEFTIRMGPADGD